MQNDPPIVQKPLRILASTFAPPLVVLSLAGIAPNDMIYADLASHSRASMHWRRSSLLIAASFRRAHVSIFGALLITFLISVSQLYPFLPLESSVVTRGQTLKILQANVLFLNKDTERLRKFILAEKPDVIVLAEANVASSRKCWPPCKRNIRGRISARRTTGRAASAWRRG